MARQEEDTAREAEGCRRSLRRLRLQNGMAVLFTAMGAMGALAVLQALIPADRGELIGSAFEAFKLIAVTVLGFVFGTNQSRTGPEE